MTVITALTLCLYIYWNHYSISKYCSTAFFIAIFSDKFDVHPQLKTAIVIIIVVWNEISIQITTI